MRPCLLYIRYCIKWYFPINLFVIAVESILENKKQGAKWVLVHWQKGFKHYQESPLYQTPVYWRSFKRVLGLLLQSQLITLFTSDQFYLLHVNAFNSGVLVYRENELWQHFLKVYGAILSTNKANIGLFSLINLNEFFLLNPHMVLKIWISQFYEKVDC